MQSVKHYSSIKTGKENVRKEDDSGNYFIIQGSTDLDKYAIYSLMSTF